MFVSNELYAHICVDCANETMNDMIARYKDTKLALIILCHYLDIYFSEDLYESIKDNANFSLGNYLKLLNGIQYKAKNFTTFLVSMIKDGIALRSSMEVQQTREEKNWSAADRKNRAYVIQTVGYDCFEDENYTDSNRKFLFNTLADYLTDDVIEDSHKLQRVIGLVKTTLQAENVDMMINAELKNSSPDYESIKKLTEIKGKLSDGINKTAADNGISEKGSNKGARNSSSITNIMKEMADNGFEEIKVNVVNALMSDSYKEVSEKNAQSLINELNLTSDDYARMLASQSVFVSDLQDKIVGLEEQLRLLKIENKKLSEGVGD